LKILVKARPYVLLIKSRAQEAFAYVWCMLLGGLIASRGGLNVNLTALAILAVLLIGLCVYVYNDVIDADMDRLNPKKKRRPLPSGKASKKEAMYLVYLSGFIGLVTALIVKLEIFLICLAWLIFFWAYSTPQIRLKKRTLIKEGTPPIGFFLCVIMGAIINGSISNTVIFAGLFSALFIFFGIPAFRDTTDIKEDRMFGVKSLATILPWKRRLEMAILFVLGIMTLTPLTYMNFGFNVIFPIVVVAMGFLILRYLFPLLNRLERANYEKALKFMTSYYFLAQISMIIASLSILP